MYLSKVIEHNRLDQGGFTLIELVVIIITLGLLAAVAVPKFADMADASKVTATQQELTTLKRAIVGNPQVVAGGTYVDRGFEGDIGFPPNRLEDLVVRPDSVAVYNPLTRLGWNGPYLDSTGGDYRRDAWGANYSYVLGSRQILAVGGSDTLSILF